MESLLLLNEHEFSLQKIYEYSITSIIVWPWKNMLKNVEPRQTNLMALKNSRDRDIDGG